MARWVSGTVILLACILGIALLFTRMLSSDYSTVGTDEYGYQEQPTMDIPEFVYLEQTEPDFPERGIPIGEPIVLRVHEDMPLFTFQRKITGFREGIGYYNPLLGDAWVISIYITDEDGNLVQEIANLLQLGFWMEEPDAFDEFRGIAGTTYWPRFADFNFDGYQDMSLLQIVGGTGRWQPAYYWLWDRELGQFVLNEQLMYIGHMSGVFANAETQQLIASVRGGPNNHIRYFYEYVNGEFILVAIEDNWFSFNVDTVYWYWEITRTDIKTGEVTVEIIPSNEDGTAVTNPPDIVYITSVVVSTDLSYPQPRIIRMDMWWVGENVLLADIIIMFDNGGVTQRITGTTANLSLDDNIDPDNPFALHFADYNEDGFSDMILMLFPYGSFGNNGYQVWLWDVDSRQFQLE